MEQQKFYIETYGCQVNVADSEVMAAILRKKNYRLAATAEHADAIFVNTCPVRDNAEKKPEEMLFGRTPQNQVAVFPKYHFKKGGLD
jgi:tRNA A37 methylthiotransferase MiaB